MIKMPIVEEIKEVVKGKDEMLIPIPEIVSKIFDLKQGDKIKFKINTKKEVVTMTKHGALKPLGDWEFANLNDYLNEDQLKRVIQGLKNRLKKKGYGMGWGIVSSQIRSLIESFEKGNYKVDGPSIITIESSLDEEKDKDILEILDKLSPETLLDDDE